MASTLVVPVVQLKKVRKHPKADKLDLAEILGYQVCIPRGKCKTDDLGVYFPADSLIPRELAEKFGVINFLKGNKNDRVGRVVLRGEPSFGLFIPSTELEWNPDWKIDQNLAEHFGIKKYEPPMKATCGDAAAYDSNIDVHVHKYTDIQNGRIFTKVFEPDEIVVATEKIHGTNDKIGFIRLPEPDIIEQQQGCPATGSKQYVCIAGSMELRRKWPLKIIPPKNLWHKIKRLFFGDVKVPAGFDDKEMKSSTYWFPWTIPEVLNLLIYVRDCAILDNYKDPDSILLYGEVFGGSINYPYGIPAGKGLGFRAFDISIDGRYKDFDEFEALCTKFKVPMAPVLYRGPFKDFDVSIADGPSTIENADNIREGVVVKPVKERIDPVVGRAVLKFIGTQYELNKKDTEDSKDI
jgi:hypothetical protein